MQNSSGPLFCVEVKELRSAFGLGLFEALLQLSVSGTGYGQDQLHPVADGVSDFVVDLIMHALPDNLEGQVDNLLILIALNEVEKTGEDCE